MLKTTGMLNDELMEYSNPGAAIRRMMDNKRLFKVRHGLYETNANIPGICLAIHIYGPSYLSFDFALSYYDLIPEAVTRFTSAVFKKHKSKEFVNSFGMYSYRDIPETAYPWGIDYHVENGYPYMIASPEKAVCDKLYTISPVRNRTEMRTLLFEDLRLDQERFMMLDHNRLIELAGSYQTVNHRIFRSFIKTEFIYA